MILPIPSLLLASVLSGAAAAVSVGSKGCGQNLKTTLQPGGRSRFFNFGSNAAKDRNVEIKRRVRIALPEKYKPDEPAPVVIAFHAKHRNASSFEVMTQFSNPILNRDAIAVYPESADSINLFWTGDPYSAPNANDDRIFAGELLDQLQDAFCIDRSRVYAVGMDNGGGLVHLLACDPVMSQRIAAFALAHPTIYTDEAMTQKEACMQKLFQPARCKPSRPVPILHVHGDANQISSYVGKSFLGKTVPVPEVLKTWVEKNGCDAGKGNTTTQMTEGRVTRFTYDCGPEDKPLVVHYALHGIEEHEWPFVPALEGRADSHGWDGTQTILDFFKSHELPEDVLVDMMTAESAPDGSDRDAGKDEKTPNAKETASMTKTTAQEGGESSTKTEKKTQEEAEKPASPATSTEKADDATQQGEKATESANKDRDEL